MTLQEWMDADKLGDEDVAAKAGTDRTTISRIRRGKQRPSWDLAVTLKKLSAGKVTLDALAGEAA